MSEQHPITPPPELVKKWRSQWSVFDFVTDSHQNIANKAARWGADQELEACCEYIGGEGKWFASPGHRLRELRATRRPKPPNLANQGLVELATLEDDLTRHGLGYRSDAIRAALKRLKELEQVNSQHS